MKCTALVDQENIEFEVDWFDFLVRCEEGNFIAGSSISEFDSEDKGLWQEDQSTIVPKTRFCPYAFLVPDDLDSEQNPSMNEPKRALFKGSENGTCRYHVGGTYVKHRGKIGGVLTGGIPITCVGSEEIPDRRKKEEPTSEPMSDDPLNYYYYNESWRNGEHRKMYPNYTPTSSSGKKPVQGVTH
ncbi:MAG: hypothetical protein R3A11_09805 [Bdellovibrionota bacterium]